MELEGLRSMMTVIAFTTFIGIVVWAWSARKRGDFDAAARSILAEDDGGQRQAESVTTNNIRGGGNE